ncbi:hypothetical protein ScPMuIL_007136 [Solemya velum]
MELSKVILKAALLVLTTAAFCVCQLSVFYLARRKGHIPSTRWYSSIFIVLVTPEVISLLTVIWNTPFLAKGNLWKWPRLKNVFTGVFVSLLEVTCICLLTIEVAPFLPVFHYFPLLNIVLLTAPFVDAFRQKGVDFHDDVENSEKKDCCSTTGKSKAVRIGAFLVGLCLSIYIIFILRRDFVLTDVASVIFALCLIALSVAWLPTVRNFIFEPRLPSDNVIYRNNVSVLYHVVKIAGFCFFTLWLFTFEAENNTFSTIFEIDVFNFDITTSVLITVSCCSVLVCNIFTSLSTKWSCNRIVLNGSSFISGPIIIGVSIYLALTGNALENFTDDSLPYTILALSLILWALPFLVWKFRLYEDTDYLLVPTEHVFTCYSINPFFLTQHLFANYTPQNIFEQCSDKYLNKKATTIFICTTMYREAEYEMRRLLISLRKLSLSEKLKRENVYIETHIFLDGGAEGGRLKEFALQLLSLVTDTLHVDITEGTGCQTPYGLQMLWMVPGGMQIFFHFKDNKKVKAKKRWSQVMYMNYIIEHRTKKVSAEQREVSESSLKDSQWPRTKPNVITITVTDENGNISHPFDENVNRPIALTKDNLSVYSENSIRDNDTIDSFSVHSMGSEGDHLDDYPSHDMTGSCMNVDAVSLSSFASIPDLRIYRESLKSNPNYHKDDCPDLPSVFTVSSHVQSTESSKVQLDERSYILATDADMGFDADAVLNAMRLSNENLGIGGICGITHPIGKRQSPLVWNQMFEYCKDFWSTKSAQNVIGSVMCCPGCFSLYRLSALTDVMADYADPTVDSLGVFTKDTGEDRWMCTLMMLRGWQLRYSYAARNTTYCPDNFGEFIKQRRRWILSDLANSLLVMKNIRQLVRNNNCFSVAFSVYLLQLFFITLLAPGSTILMLAIGFDFIFHIETYVTAPIIIVLILAYTGVCVSDVRPKIMEHVTKWFMVFAGIAGSIVIIGSGYFVTADILREIEEGTLQFQEHFLIFSVVIALFYAAILHPRDAWVLVCGIWYVFFFPALYMVLPVYTICNLVDQSWGTREDQKAEIPKSIYLPKMKKKLKKKKKKKKESKVPRLTDDDVSSVFQMEGEDRHQEENEQEFWSRIVDSLLGPEINRGSDKAQLAALLLSLRRKSVVIFLVINFIWAISVCVVYAFLLSSSGGLNAIGVIFGVIYGYSLSVQVIGMTVCRVNDAITWIARLSCDEDKNIWVHPRET